MHHATAIRTSYLGPSNVRGSRVKALARKRCGDLPELSLTDDWDDGSNPDRNHCRAAHLLAAKLDWPGVYVAGSLPDGSRVWVNIGRSDPLLIDPLTRRGEENRDWFQLAPRKD